MDQRFARSKTSSSGSRVHGLNRDHDEFLSDPAHGGGWVYRRGLEETGASGPVFRRVHSFDHPVEIRGQRIEWCEPALLEFLVLAGGEDNELPRLWRETATGSRAVSRATSLNLFFRPLAVISGRSAIAC